MFSLVWLQALLEKSIVRDSVLNGTDVMTQKATTTTNQAHHLTNITEIPWQSGTQLGKRLYRKEKNGKDSCGKGGAKELWEQT